MNESTINFKGEEVKIRFGSWVMMNLEKKGWGIDLSSILSRISSNVYESLAEIIYFGICEANGRSQKMQEISIDEMYDVIDELGKDGPAEVLKIRNVFLVSAFGDDILEILNTSSESNQKEEVKKNKRSTRSKLTGK